MKFHCLCSLLMLVAIGAPAQWYNVTFRGVAYLQDGAGNLTPRPMTERTLIDAVAERLSLPTNNLALIYHVESGGDSIKVVDKTTSEQKMRLFLFGFGQDIGRTAVTNSAGTEIRGIEYIYTTEWSRYSSQNSHSMGAVALNRRIITDANNNVRQTIDGQHLQWCVLPYNGESAKTCVGSFVTGTLFTAQ